MIELFALYQYAFVLCVVSSFTLCLVGHHLVARNESLQVLALAQGALVGNLLGRILSPESEWVILISSLFAFTLLKAFFTLIAYKKFSRETFFIVAYISLLAMSYLLISIFPGLEGHMAVGFFGDIVSLSTPMTLLLTVFFTVFFLLLLIFHKTLFRKTFEKSMLQDKTINYLEELLFALVFICSLYGLGFLFTVAMMIFPAVILGTNCRSLRVMLVSGLSSSVIASVMGLGLSIAFERLSTVPSQVMILLLFLMIKSIFLSKLRIGYEYDESRRNS